MLRDKEGVTFQENFNHEKIRKETPLGQPISIVNEFWSELEEVIREGGRRLIQSVLEEEVNNWVESMSHICNEKGRRLIRRNGYSPERAIHTGMDPVQIRQPRARNTKEHKFTVRADGIHFNVRLGDKENKRMCFLVLPGSTVKGVKGKKENAQIHLSEGKEKNPLISAWLPGNKRLRS